MNFYPRPYQTEFSDKICAKNNLFGILAMGSGKTAATLHALERLLDTGEVNRVLIVAPLRVAEHVWPDESRKWDFKYGISEILGSRSRREQALRESGRVSIINRDNFQWLVEQGDWSFDMLIVDESTSFKNPSTARFRAFKKIRRHLKRVLLLTGTPAPNSYLELWSQVFMLDGGKRLCKTYANYKIVCFDAGYGGYDYTLKSGMKDEIDRRISSLAHVVGAYDGLPGRVDLRDEIDLNADAMAVYDQMRKEFALEFDGKAIPAQNAAVLINKLLQISNGFIYGEDGAVKRIHDDKITALEEIAECGENLLVAYGYREDFEKLKREFPQAVDIKSPGAINAWNAGRVKMLLAHPASAGHGLNLQTGGQRIVWYSQTWSNELYQQFNARLYRLGQDKTVFIHHIVSRGTVDEIVLDRLTQRESEQQSLVHAVKTLIEGVI